MYVIPILIIHALGSASLQLQESSTISYELGIGVDVEAEAVILSVAEASIDRWNESNPISTIHHTNSIIVLETVTDSEKTDVCNRTEAVRNAIVRLISDVNNCADVTSGHLAAITGMLNLGYRRVSRLKSGDFDGLSSLTALDLSSASLESIPDGLFRDLSSLKALYLWGNPIETLPSKIFNGLTQLTWLYLDQIELKRLPDGIFDGLTSLTTLDLSKNELETIQMEIFDGLVTLESLDLSRNDLRTLPNGLFDDLRSLRVLYLWDNPFGTLPGGIFKELTSLEKLGLWNNSLTVFPADLFDGLNSLKWLGLWDNSLSMIPSGSFDGLTALETLFLGDNEFQSFPDGVFDRMTSLEILGLWDNSIHVLQDGIFDELTSLHVLGLHENEIRFLPGQVFEQLESLPLNTFYAGGDYFAYPGLSLYDNPGQPFKSEVDAGPDQFVEQGVIVSLRGTATGPWGNLMRWQWSQVDGLDSDIPVAPVDSVSLSGADTSTPKFTAPMVGGDYYFKLVTAPAYSGMPLEPWGHAYSDPDWITIRVGTVTHAVDQPANVDFALLGNYPNPFHSSTTILIDLPEVSTITVDVFNIVGQQVYQVEFPEVAAGPSKPLPLELAGLSSGTYIYRIVARTSSGIHVARGYTTFMK
ncbi:MAG: leucine-rich repeat protein [Bacteroidetes bacterium]|nr:leucine-rich repeat protein [Bacteroidota bacterium]